MATNLCCKAAMTEVYEYRLFGRRVATWITFGIAVFLLFIALIYNGPQILLIGWAIMAAWLGWTLLRNPVTGIRIDGESWTWFKNARSESLDLGQIDRVCISQWSEGPDTCDVFLKGGGTWDVPGTCLPSGQELEQALRARNVNVTLG